MQDQPIQAQTIQAQTIQAQFLFDFASPNAWFAWKLLPAMEARTGVRFAHVPVLLGGLFKATGNTAPMVQYATIPAKLAYQMLEIRRFIARHSLATFRMNPHFPINTLSLMRGAVAADSLGILEPYCATVYAAMWEHGVKMDDPAQAAATLAAAGLPADRLLAATAEDKAGLAANTQAAVDAGAFGLPSFVVAGDLYFGKDRLADVERAIAEA
jgi:2-hydroxychromene-2-carboxylate isomerase